MDRVTLYKYPWKRTLGAKILDLSACHFLLQLDQLSKLRFLTFDICLPDSSVLLKIPITDCTIQALRFVIVTSEN